MSDYLLDGRTGWGRWGLRRIASSSKEPDSVEEEKKEAAGLEALQDKLGRKQQKKERKELSKGGPVDSTRAPKIEDSFSLWRNTAPSGLQEMARKFVTYSW